LANVIGGKLDLRIERRFATETIHVAHSSPDATPEDFLACLTAIGADNPFAVFSIRAIFSRQLLGEWTLHNAICVLCEEA
jgi:hypothetical protein